MIKSFSEWLKECDNIPNKDYEKVMLSEGKRSLSRFLKHLKHDNMIIVMSVDRNPFRKKEDGTDSDPEIQKNRQDENRSARISFRNTLLHFGAAFIPVVGEYEEEDPTTHTKTAVVEHSFVIFITNDIHSLDILNMCINMAKKYQQDSILVASKDVGYFYYTRDCNGHKTGDFEHIGGFHPTNIGQYYSVLGTRRQDRNFNTSYYYEKGHRRKTNRTTKAFEFGGFPNEKVAKFLNEGIIDFDNCLFEDFLELFV